MDIRLELEAEIEARLRQAAAGKGLPAEDYARQLIDQALMIATQRPLFITFEGIDGAGKTTQIALLRAALEAAGHAVYVTREPGGDGVGEAIREVLLAAKHDIAPRAELLLFLASRAQHAETVLRPHLEAGRIVLCDRYTDSMVAYQGYGRGLPLDEIERLNRFATGGLTPALTILLDLPVAAGLARQAERNRMEAQSAEFYARVAEGFRALARAHPDRIRVVDASRTPEAVHADVLSLVREVLGVGR